MNQIIIQNKSDVSQAEALFNSDPFEYLSQVDELLGWCYDPNWPVAPIISGWISRLGSHLLPAIEKINSGKDLNALYNIITNVIAFVPKENRNTFRPLLIRWAVSPTPSEKAEEVDDIARDVLTRWEVIT